ncbi:MAG: DUF402 domain-containing protein [Actinomycetota bacterium]
MDFRKWPDSSHWQIDVAEIGFDEYGAWFALLPGMTGKKGDAPPRTFQRAAVFVVREGVWWTANFRTPADGHRAYVDIITPATRADRRVTMIDLDLDVRWNEDGTISVLDEDEFADHRARLGYPEDVVANARRACADVQEMVKERVEPFGIVWERWLERLVDGEFERDFA